MKITFINPSLRPESQRRMLPVGLACIMTAAKKAGFVFDLIDMDINCYSMKDLEKVLSSKISDVYLVGCIVTGYKFIRQIADIIRKINPQALIVSGNSVASSVTELLLNNTQVDIAVLGEGDNTIVELLRALEAKTPLSGVNGIAFKKEGRLSYTPKRSLIDELDTIGFPDWDIFDLAKYNTYGRINANVYSSNQILAYPLNSARGCPFSCTFCYHEFKGQKYRRYSETAIIGEINRLHNRYGSNLISFWDELTFPTIKSVDNFLNKLKAMDFKIKWQASARGNLFNDNHLGLIQEMRDLGCESISFSLENADPQILKAINKKITVTQFIEQTKILHRGGVTPLTSVIFGYPQETPETIKHTIKVCEECNLYPSVGFLLPLPKTPIYEWARDNGYIGDEVKYLERIGDRQDFHINLTGMDDQEFVGLVKSQLSALAKQQGLKLDSVLKTTTYQNPKTAKA